SHVVPSYQGLRTGRDSSTRRAGPPSRGTLLLHCPANTQGRDVDQCGREEIEHGPGLLFGAPRRVQVIPAYFGGSHEVRRGVPLGAAQNVEDPEGRLVVP